MRKIILSFITLIGLFSLSHGFEANIKIGYDFFRREHSESLQSDYERGFVLGVEVLPLTFKDEKIKLGVGFEYNFGESFSKFYSLTTSYKGENVFKSYWGSNNATMSPVYATAKFTYYRPKNIDLNLYAFARLGYGFLVKEPQVLGIVQQDGDESGIYYGLGLGIDYKYFLAEILYDGNYTNYIKGRNYSTYYEISNFVAYLHHKVGLRLGIQLGTQHFKKPQIIKEN